MLQLNFKWVKAWVGENLMPTVPNSTTSGHLITDSHSTEHLLCSSRKFTLICNLWSDFVYKKDSVLVVDKGSYDLCNTTKPISAFNYGKTVIELDEPGPIYFISSIPEHCKNGQRLIINVMTLHPASRTPPSVLVLHFYHNHFQSILRPHHQIQTLRPKFVLKGEMRNPLKRWNKHALTFGGGIERIVRCE